MRDAARAMPRDREIGDHLVGRGRAARVGELHGIGELRDRDLDLDAVLHAGHRTDDVDAVAADRVAVTVARDRGPQRDHFLDGILHRFVFAGELAQSPRALSAIDVIEQRRCEVGAAGACVGRDDRVRGRVADDRIGVLGDQRHELGDRALVVLRVGVQPGAFETRVASARADLGREDRVEVPARGGEVALGLRHLREREPRVEDER